MELLLSLVEGAASKSDAILIEALESAVDYDLVFKNTVQKMAILYKLVLLMLGSNAAFTLCGMWNVEERQLGDFRTKIVATFN